MMLNKAMPEKPMANLGMVYYLVTLQQLTKNMSFCAGEGRFAMNAGDVQCMVVEMCLFDRYI